MAADLVSTATASILTGVNVTSVSNACVSGDLEYTTQGGQMFVSLAAVRTLARGAGVQPR
jgi:hypothetical protein